MKREQQALIGVLVVAVCGGAFWLWRSGSTQPPAASPEPAAAVVAAPPAASAPAILHPIETASAPQEPADAATTLVALFGKKAVDELFFTDDFAARFAATIDNLGRPTASPRLWPMRPTAGRFSVDEAGGATVVGAGNGLRYAPALVVIESVDLKRAVEAYKRFYPRIQAAYENLGYPNGYFNDRFVAVIDSLLATPEPPAPLAVRQPRIEGGAAPARPWLLYEFTDPALAALPSGQKLLLRMGPANERRVKARLKELRRLIASDGH